jgi:nitrous oxidase accessory protein NosD
MRHGLDFKSPTGKWNGFSFLKYCLFVAMQSTKNDEEISQSVIRFLGIHYCFTPGSKISDDVRQTVFLCQV